MLRCVSLQCTTKSPVIQSARNPKYWLSLQEGQLTSKIIQQSFHEAASPPGLRPAPGEDELNDFITSSGSFGARRHFIKAASYRCYCLPLRQALTSDTSKMEREGFILQLTIGGLVEPGHADAGSHFQTLCTACGEVAPLSGELQFKICPRFEIR